MLITSVAIEFSTPDVAQLEGLGGSDPIGSVGQPGGLPIRTSTCWTSPPSSSQLNKTIGRHYVLACSVATLRRLRQQSLPTRSLQRTQSNALVTAPQIGGRNQRRVERDRLELNITQAHERSAAALRDLPADLPADPE